MAQARRESVSLTGVRNTIAKAFDLFGIGREADEPAVLALIEVAEDDLAEAAGRLDGPVSMFSREWTALVAAQVEQLRASNRPTRVEFGAALLALEFLVSVIDLQLAREGVPERCISCESPQLTAIPEEAAVFECLACGLRTAYQA